MNSQLFPPIVSQQAAQRRQAAAAFRLAAGASPETGRRPRLSSRIALAVAAAVTRDSVRASVPAPAATD